MRKLIIGLFLLGIIALSSFGQVPEYFNYQAVLRNSSGELVKNTSITVRISLLQGSTTGAVQYAENHAVSTNNYGQFTIQIGGGTDATSIFTSIDWSQPMFLKTEVANPAAGTLVDMGTTQLIAVPYALYAKNVANKDDADADPVNEIQDLNLTGNTLTITNKTNPTAIDLAPFSGVNTDNQTLILTDTDLSISGGNSVDLSPLQDGVNDADNNPTNELQSITLTGDTLRISNGNHVVFPYDSSKWATNGSKLYYNTGNVGIGSSDPMSKLEVKSSATGALFQVINANNDTVFAVYPDGVKVFVDPDAKGKVGGFAVSGRTPTKLGETVEYFRVTPDSTRVYVNDSYNGKGKVGGFAVSGRTPTKGVIKDYLYINKDSTRIYINDTLTSKGKVGGFAVSGRTPTKGFTNEYFFVNQDSTRVYVNDTSLAKGKVGGFAVSGRTPTKTTGQKFIDLTKANYFIGHESGQKLLNGLYNSTLGYQSGLSLTNGESNSFIGYQSGYNTNSGKGNLFIGYQTGFSNQSGNYNSFLGYKAGYSNTSGLYNTFLGSYSGYSNQTTSNNTFVGDSTGYKNKGSSNSFFGTKTGLNTTTGSENVFVGNMTGYKNTIGAYNVYIGNKAGYLNNAYYNVLIGNMAGYKNSGSLNVFIGLEAGRDNGTGGSNVYVGSYSGLINTTGTSNVFLGFNAGTNNKDGNQNVIIGKDAGFSNDTGDDNVYIGHKTAELSTQGWLNVAIGSKAGYKNDGMANVMIGTEAGYSDSTGLRNVYVGTSAGYSNKTGFRNVFIGSQAGYYSKGSNKLYIESTNADSLNALIYGEFDNDFVRINNKLGIGRMPATNNLEVEGTASKSSAGDWLLNSDRRIKTDIQDIENAKDILLKLRPVKYKYTNYWKSKHTAIEDKYYYNFVAQEYQQVFPESVKGSGEFIEGSEDEVLQMDSYNAQIVTIKAVQELILENMELKKQLLEITKRLENLEK